MTFTSTPPTRPGFYAWKRDEEGTVFACRITKLNNVMFGVSVQELKDTFGLWCLLVPAEEVEKAFREGCFSGYAFDGRNLSLDKLERELTGAWLTSNARKVVEGEK